MWIRASRAKGKIPSAGGTSPASPPGLTLLQPICEPSLAGLPQRDLQETPWRRLLGGQALIPLPAAEKVSEIQFTSQYLGFTLKRRDLFINLYINRCVAKIFIYFKTSFLLILDLPLWCLSPRCDK